MPEKTYTKDEVESLIQQTTKTIFEQFAPVLQSIALTPEKLREAQKPYEDPLVIARRNHERKEFHLQEQERDASIKANQAACTHKDAQENWAIRLQHNFHDNMPRGLCAKCDLLIHPHHWDWRPVTMPDGEIKSEGFIIQAHPLYYVVQQLETRS